MLKLYKRKFRTKEWILIKYTIKEMVESKTKKINKHNDGHLSNKHSRL